MLGTHQRWTFGDGGIGLAQYARRHRGFIIARTLTRGLGAMELGGARGLHDKSAWAGYVRQGEIEVETHRVRTRIGPGTWVFGTDPHTRMVQTSPDSDILRLFYRGAERHETVIERPSKSVLERWERVADTLLCVRPIDPKDLLNLGVPGISAERVRRLTIPLPALDYRLAQLVERCTTQLKSHPGIQDIAEQMALSPRRTSEALGHYFTSYHASFVGWRDYLATLRAEMGLQLLAGGRLKSRRIAADLGYRSAPALYHALERRGLRVAEVELESMGRAGRRRRTRSPQGQEASDNSKPAKAEPRPASSSTLTV